jgi:hypothetical protein
MDTMEEECYTFHAGCFWGKVKHEAMEEVLGERPEKQAEGESEQDMEREAPSRFQGACCQMIPDSDVHKVHRNRDPDDGDNSGMDVCEKFENIRFE